MSDMPMNPPTPIEGTEQQQESNQPKLGVGAQLAAHREAHSWTIEQVASQLNLAPRQIQALESDNYAVLPGMASVRGFIRAYAKLLKIDPTPLIAMIAVDSPVPSEPMQTRRPLSAPFSDANRLPSMGRADIPAKSALIALVIVLLLAGAFAWYQLELVSAPDSLPPKASGPELAGASMQNAPVIGATNTPTTEPMETANAASNVPASTPALPSAGPVAMEPSTAASPVAAPSKRPATAAGKDALVLTTREDSWIEIKRANGTSVNSVLFSRLVKAGSTETIEITEPVSLIVGNAAGVDATLRGAPVDLKTGVKSNVARLTLE